MFTKDLHYITRASLLAEKHDSHGRVKTCVIAVKNGKIVGIGRNNYAKSGASKSPLYSLCGIHAELDLLSRHNVAGSTIYIAAVTPTKALACSKPCRRCTTLLLNSTIKNVVYVAMDGTILKQKVQDLVSSESSSKNHSIHMRGKRESNG